MKKTIFLRPNRFLIISVVWLTQCNQVSDLQPKDDSLPLAVAEMISTQFPEAENMEIKTVEKDSAWEAYYSLNDTRYHVGMDTKRIRYRAQLISATVPEDIRNIVSHTPIAGGEFGEFWKDITDSQTYYQYNFTRYKFNGVSYLLEWTPYSQTGGGFTYDLTLRRYFKLYFPVYSPLLGVREIDKIPSKIRDYLADRRLEVSQATIQFDADNTKEFAITGTSGVGLYTFNFDKNLRLLGTSYAPELIFYSFQELPGVVRNGITDIPFLKNCSLVIARKFVDEHGTTFSISMKNDLAERETFGLTMNSSGKLTALSFSANNKTAR